MTWGAVGEGGGYSQSVMDGARSRYQESVEHRSRAWERCQHKVLTRRFIDVDGEASESISWKWTSKKALR